LAKEVYGILSAPVRRSPERERRKKPQFFLNSTNKKAKSVTLHIQGLDSTVSSGSTAATGRPVWSAPSLLGGFVFYSSNESLCISIED